MQAVILAGGALGGSLKEAFPALSNKAHLSINGKMLIEYVLAATLGCRYVEKVFIVGDEDFLSVHIKDERVNILQDTGSVYDNFIMAANCCQEEKMLLLTGDIPLLDNVALEDFIEACRDDREICYSVVDKKTILQYDANGRRTYAKIGDNVFTGGNVFLVDVAAIRRIKPQVEAIFAKRKSVLALLNMVGIGLVLKYIFGSVQLTDIECCAGRILKSDVQAVVCTHASVGIDVDKLQDFELVSRHLNK